jgi:hypothetical protein
MKEKFKDVSFRPDSMTKIELCNDIIDEYVGAGLRLTLRQLYYQLITKNVMPNNEKSYRHLSSLISDARLAGLVDWNAIEDRVRQPKMQSEFADLSELVEAALSSYRLPRWKGQDYYVELWVEKDALAGVLTPLARKFHVTLMVNRGYSSQSAMYESAQRFIYNGDRQGKSLLLFYLGDHDPSGEDMVRDISDRMIMFGVEDIEVKKIALTMEQIKKYNPPPNPTKISDSRAAAYIEKYGDSSWEVDALPPKVLNKLITSAFEEVIDQEKMNEIIETEEEDKRRLRAVNE